MTFKKQVEFECPYCGFLTLLFLDAEPGSHVYYCEGEGGGCGRMFVGELLVIVTAKAHKVEGEAEKPAENDRDNQGGAECLKRR